MLFYSDLRMSIFLIPVGVIWYRNLLREVEQKKIRQFEQQFQNALQSLQAQIAQRGGSNLEPLALHDMPRELAALGNDVNYMLARLGQALKVERALAANAAHELRALSPHRRAIR